MHGIFHDRECEAQVAGTFFTRCEPDTTGSEETSDSTGCAGIIDIETKVAGYTRICLIQRAQMMNFLRQWATTIRVLIDFLLYWWEARICRYEFRCQYLAELTKRLKLSWGGGYTKLPKKTE